MSKVIESMKNNMADNIDSMKSLMTMFNTDLYVIEHLILCLGDCYYYDPESSEIIECYSTLTADEDGKVEYTIYVLNNPEKIQLKVSPEEAYIFLNKDKEELEIIMGM